MHGVFYFLLLQKYTLTDPIVLLLPRRSGLASLIGVQQYAHKSKQIFNPSGTLLTMTTQFLVIRLCYGTVGMVIIGLKKAMLIYSSQLLNLVS